MEKPAYIRYAERPNRRTRSYVLEEKVIARVDVLAQELGVYHSSVVNLLLEKALTEVESGRWPLKALPVAFVAGWGDSSSE